MSKEAAKTGTGPTALVAVEQNFPKHERIIDDALAHRILPFGKSLAFMTRLRPVRDWMIRATEKDLPGIWACMMCRKRYIDDKLTMSASQIEAVVNLGAGFDTRAFRLPALSDICVWELDQPGSIKAKMTKLHSAIGAIPARIKLVPIDFDRENPEAVLGKYGYTPDKRTFFIWEAVTQYLTEEGIRATFDFLVKAAPGSRLVFAYVRKDFLDGRAKHGWQVIEDTGYEELVEKYVRPTGRMLASTPIERIVYAEKS